MELKVPDLNELMLAGYTIHGEGSTVVIETPTGRQIRISDPEFERLLNEDIRDRFEQWIVENWFRPAEQLKWERR